MHVPHKLLLLATMAIATMSLAAPSAFAQTEPLAHFAVPDVRVSAEPAATPCPAVVRNAATNVVTGGCVAHKGGSNIVLIGHLFGIESVQSSCNVELDLRTDADGEGYVVHQELTQSTQGTCTRRPCGFGQAASLEGRPWEVTLRETGTVAPREVFTALFCIENLDGSSPTHCEVSLPLTETTNHRYQFVAAGPSPSGGARGHGTMQPFCEIVGTFTTEATQVGLAEGQSRTPLEVNHL